MCSVCCIMPNIVGHTGPPMWTQSSGLYKGLFWGNKRTARLENDNNFAPSLNEPLHSYYPERKLVFIANDNNLCLLATILSSTCLCWWFECFLVRKSKTEEEKKQFKRSPFESLRVGLVEAQMAKRERDSPAHRAFSPLTCLGHTTTLTIKHTKTCMKKINNVVRETKPCWSRVPPSS